MEIGKHIAAAGLAVAVICTSATPAFSASCWQAEEASAAKVRDLQTRLMVAGLKCRGNGPEMLAVYNRFVVAHRSSIQRYNNVLRARFIRLSGKSGGERDYDRYTTALANAYGATDADQQACDEMVVLAKRAVLARPAELVPLAEDFGLDPKMSGGVCRIRMASAKQR